MTERIAEARANLERNESSGGSFADITHELATPLTSIRGFAETLLDPKVAVSAEERARYLRGLLEEAARLDRLISDLFDLARLEAGASVLHPERLDWTALCRNTADRFRQRYEEAGLRLEGGSRRRRRGSRPTGGGWSRCWRTSSPTRAPLRSARRARGGRGRAVCGRFGAPARAERGGRRAGRSPGTLGRVFERFYRADSSGGDGKGSGLGLAIVKEIVERHRGTVRAESNDPHGLRIVIELPAADRAAPPG